jgi:hypothetical protein
VGSEQHGLFSASCYLHTGFEYYGPYLNGLSYLTAFSQWLNGTSVHMIEDCCSGESDVAFNPTCPTF